MKVFYVVGLLLAAAVPSVAVASCSLFVCAEADASAACTVDVQGTLAEIQANLPRVTLPKAADCIYGAYGGGSGLTIGVVELAWEFGTAPCMYGGIHPPDDLIPTGGSCTVSDGFRGPVVTCILVEVTTTDAVFGAWTETDTACPNIA